MNTTNICRRVIFNSYRKGMGPSFTLTMWDDVGYNAMGKIRIRYRLNMSGTKGHPVTLFAGSDFATPHASDSDESVAGLMGFLCLRPGDTDADYFDGYSEAQKAFCDDHAEALACEVEARFPEGGTRKAPRRTPPTSTPPAGNGGMTVVRDDLQLCEDCVIVAVNGDVSGIESDERIAAVEAGLEALGPHLVPDFDSETGEGYDEFRTVPCDCCGSKLYGSRHRFAVLGPKSGPDVDAPFTVTADEVDFEVTIEPEDATIEGFASAIDDETDAAIATEIRAQLASGNDMAWCRVVVTASVEVCGHTVTGRDSLGCVSVESREALDALIEEHGMRQIALAALNSDLGAIRE